MKSWSGRLLFIELIVNFNFKIPNPCYVFAGGREKFIELYITIIECVLQLIAGYINLIKPSDNLLSTVHHILATLLHVHSTTCLCCNLYLICFPHTISM